MSKYTTEIRFICESYAGLSESVGLSKTAEIIEKARSLIFDFDYPIFDEEYRKTLETKILKHYYTQEIGFEVVGLWKLYLDEKNSRVYGFFIFKLNLNLKLVGKTDMFGNSEQSPRNRRV